MASFQKNAPKSSKDHPSLKTGGNFVDLMVVNIFNRRYFYPYEVSPTPPILGGGRGSWHDQNSFGTISCDNKIG